MRTDRRIKILQVTIGDGSYGGVASFLYSYYSHMDHEKVQFDFLYCGENSLQSKMGSEVLKESKITTLHALKAKNNGIGEYRKLSRGLKRYFNENKYDIVHIHTANAFVSALVTFYAKDYAVCIAHSHNTKSITKNGNKVVAAVKDVIRKPCRSYILAKNQYYFACSKAAGVNLYGKKILTSPKFKIINNAIDVEKYAYNPEIRTACRAGEKIIFGQIGRLTEQKNPLFLLDVFEEIHKKEKNTELWMVGEGELKQTIEQAIQYKKLNDSVKLLGRREDVAELMQGMDAFIFPSLYEGLSIVTIEAQASGLPIFASDSISPEHQITDLLFFIPLAYGADKWAEIIISRLKEQKPRRNMTRELTEAGYEISDAAKRLERIYEKVLEENGL